MHGAVKMILTADGLIKGGEFTGSKCICDTHISIAKCMYICYSESAELDIPRNSQGISLDIPWYRYSLT